MNIQEEKIKSFDFYCSTCYKRYVLRYVKNLISMDNLVIVKKVCDHNPKITIY